MLVLKHSAYGAEPSRKLRTLLRCRCSGMCNEGKAEADWLLQRYQQLARAPRVVQDHQESLLGRAIRG